MEPPHLTEDEQTLLLEQLGDVFLTEDRRDTRRDDTPAEPAASAEATDHPLQGPAPIRLRPKVQRPGGETHSSEPQTARTEARPLQRPGTDPQKTEEGAEQGERAAEVPHAPHASTRNTHTERAGDRFATEDPRPVPDEPPAAQAELVLLGNLPGLSGPWLTQYAQLIAEQDGPVAVVRVDDDGIDVELVEPQDASLSAAAAFTRFVTGHNGRLDPVTLLDALVRREQQPVRNVLVLGDTSADAATIRRYLAVEDWTVMTGHDDAAVVASYGAIKQMIEAVPEVATRHFGLMVMGCDEEPARHAANKVAQTAASLLEHPLRWLGHHKRMMPVQQRPLGSFPADAQAWNDLCTWLSALVPPPDEMPHEPDEPHEPEEPGEAASAAGGATTPAEPHTNNHTSSHTHNRAPEATEPSQPPRTPPRQRPHAATEQRPHATAAEQRDEAAGIAPPPHPTSPEHSAPRPQSTPPPRSTPSSTATPPPPQAAPNSSPAHVPATAAETPTLADFLTGPDGILPDGIALDARCPDHAEAELLLDGAGVLHVLARYERRAGDRAADVDAAILTLMQIRRWADRHRALLQLTRRQLRFDREASPRLHLFTDRADLATPIAAELGDEVTLHLLQRIAIGEASTWFCTPLTTPPGGSGADPRRSTAVADPAPARPGVVSE